MPRRHIAGTVICALALGLGGASTASAQVREGFWAEYGFGRPPASSAVQVGALAIPGMMIEVEAIAVLENHLVLTSGAV